MIINLVPSKMGWDMWLKASTSRQPQIRLNELIPGSVYIFRVKAENPYGVSEPSGQSEPIHLPAAASATNAAARCDPLPLPAGYNGFIHSPIDDSLLLCLQSFNPTGSFVDSESWMAQQADELMTTEPVDMDDTTISSSNLGPRDEEYEAFAASSQLERGKYYYDMDME